MYKKILSFLIVLAMIFTLFPVGPKAVDSFNNGLAAQLTFAPPVVNVANVGYGIQRTMRLLETSTALNKNTVRIAFCGQSITDGNPWTLALIAFLKNKYPNADIQYKNFGIGGYNTWLMQGIIENDITSFYPDLVFFYDYGDMTIYENMIKLIREKTVSEVVIQNEHLDTSGGTYGSDINSFTYLPAIANRLGCELADVRTYWKNYLDANGLTANSMLTDVVHLNSQGQALMYEILKQYLVYKPVDETTYDDRTTKYLVGTNVNWVGKTLTLPFSGNRIEVDSPVQAPGNASVLVNAKKPSNYLELYNNTRYTNLGSHVYASYYRKIDFLKPSIPQTWDILFTKINSKGNYDFVIYGSVSGNQGTGNTSVDFTTTDGSMMLPRSSFYNNSNPAQNTHLIFDVTLNGTDSLAFSGVEKIASNLPSNSNTLVLQNSSDVLPNISYFKSYRPGFLLAAPRVNAIALGTNYINGTTNKSASVEVKVNGVLFNGTAGTDGYFNVVVPKVAAGSVIDVTASVSGAKSQIARTKLDGAMPTPIVKKIDSVYSNSTVVTGSASNSSIISVTIGAKVYKSTASAVNGYYKVSIPKTKPGTILKIKATLYSEVSAEQTSKVLPSAPKINKVTTKSKAISGTSYPYSVIKIIYNYKTIYSVKATSKGTFTVKTKGATMRVGKYVTASMKFAGLTSAVTKIKVTK